jgi:Mlc titration factor MtfA (ptsG expression regulator)
MLSWLRRGPGGDAVAITPDLWRQATAPWLFMRGVPEPDAQRLRALCGQFLARKHFSGTHGLEITPLMQVHIAAQACILVLELGIDWYDGWSEVIVYPSQFAPEREIVDEDGVVHLTQDPMAGEAWLGGPVVLSYEDVAMTGDEEARVAGYNVVIHEFAHKLDMRHGEPNGFPPLHPGMSSVAWRKAFTGAYEDFCQLVDEADELAEHDDGEALDTLPIDPYGAESPGEFFAVVSEAFFETPELLEPTYPAVYEQLRLFYRQDPLARLGAPAL